MASLLFFQRIAQLPIWWYGRGLHMAFQKCVSLTSQTSENFGLRVWMKNLFNPMYGDTSFTGRAISFGIRLVMILVRGLGVILSAILFFALFAVYLLLPPFVIIALVYHAGGIPSL